MQQAKGFYGQSQLLADADAALVAWRERWEKVPEVERDWHLDAPPRVEVHSPDYCPPEEEGGNDYADTRPPINLMEDHRFIPVTGNRYCGECGGGKLHPIHPPEAVPHPPKFYSPKEPFPPEEEGGSEWKNPNFEAVAAGATVHRFIPVTDSRYCGECGGGKLHPIHTQLYSERINYDHAAPYFPEQHKPHGFIPGENHAGASIFCAECGGGILHPVHEVCKCGAGLDYMKDMVLQRQCYKCARQEEKKS
jgi:hypothetical protein